MICVVNFVKKLYYFLPGNVYEILPGIFKAALLFVKECHRCRNIELMFIDSI